MVDDQQVYLNVTEGIPNLQSWFTTIGHHGHMPLEINTQKPLECEHLGDKLSQRAGVVVYSDLLGVLPLKEEYVDTFDDIVLNGKLVFYE